MAEGARIAEAAGADIIDINMGCPARHVTGGQSGSALMRDLDHALDADRGDGRGGESAGDAEDAARLGRSLAQRARTRAPRRSRRRADDHRARPHALPVLQGRRPIGPPCARSRMRSPFRSSSTATSRRSRRRSQALEASGRRRRDDRPRRAGPALVARADRPPARNRQAETAPPLAEQLAHIRALYDEICSHYGLRIGLQATRASISAGRSRSRPQYSRAPR